MLKIKQAYLTLKINDIVQSSLTELTAINLKITNWYENKSSHIKLLSRSQDINLNESVRIYHYGLQIYFIKRSTIMKLQTPAGIVEGHHTCAAALEDNVADHLLNLALLDPHAQEVLLSGVLH